MLVVARNMVRIVDDALEFEAFGVHMFADSPLNLRFSEVFSKISAVPGEREGEEEGAAPPGGAGPKDENGNDEPLMKVESFASLFRVSISVLKSHA